MRKTVVTAIAGGMFLAFAGAANAQTDSHAPAAPAAGTVNSRDVMTANRERDAAYNQLAARGVKVTDRDRDDSRQKRASAVLATAADLTPGAQVRDVKGVPIGTIATLGANEVIADSSQAVIDTGEVKIGVPLSAFGKDKKGLMLGITADKFNELVAQTRAKAPPKEPEGK